jgi:nitroreductase
MDKLAPTEHPIHDLLRRRWSPIAFDENRPVERETLNRVFEAARWAASSFNAQPWNYIVGVKAEDPEMFNKLASTLVPGNAWAHHVPVLALSVAKTAFAHNGQPNRHAFHDTGAASAELALEATSLGLFVHQMAGFDVEKARQVLQIPDGYEPVAMMAIGYPGEPQKLDEKDKPRQFGERRRKPQKDFVFYSGWANTAG